MSENPVVPQPVSEAAPQSAPAATPTPAPAPAPEEQIDIEHFAKVKLRVGKILSAEPVPKSSKLLKLQVDLGAELGQRQVVSGIAKFYTPEALIGKRIVVVANLKPAKLMGVESCGMLLAASTAGDTALALIEPHESMPEGATVR